MSIIFDKSDNYVSVFCDACSSWHAFAWDMEDAEHRAADHEERCHPGNVEVRHRVNARHAARRKRATTP